MARSAKGARRPAGVAGCAVAVAKIATGEIEETKLKYPTRHNTGAAGGKARAKSLNKVRRLRKRQQQPAHSVSYQICPPPR